MVNDPQSASPVISPRISTTSGVFSQVRSLVDDRLDHTVNGVNRVPHVIAASRASQPEATSSNEMVADIVGYSPQPGSQMARHMRLDLQNNPGRQVDQVIDAIQRYLNIEPRREPTADPKAEASVARHPQQIIQSSQRWNDATYYQFASNGGESYQVRPEYRAWGGRLELKLENEGTTDISAPPSSSPQPGSSPMGQATSDPARAAQESMAQLAEIFGQSAESTFLPANLPGILASSSSTQVQYITHDPVMAAQESMSQMNDLLGDAGDVMVGIPAMPMSGDLWQENSILGENVTHDPARAAQESLAQLQGMLGQAEEPTIALLPMMPDNPYFDPSIAANNTIRYVRQLLSGVPIDEREIGGGNFSDDPAFSPANAWRTALKQTDENWGGAPQPPVLVGPPNMADDPLSAPERAWSTTTVVEEGLVAANQGVIGGGRAAEFRPRGYDQAYVRAMRIMDELNIGRLSTGGAWNNQA